jgi:hypothetical protein
MAKADQFRQYAEEAMRWAFQSKTEKEKQAYDIQHEGVTKKEMEKNG